MVLVFSFDAGRPCDQSVTLRYELEPLMVSHHPTSFGSLRRCGSRNVMVLVCHVISEDHGDQRVT